MAKDRAKRGQRKKRGERREKGCRREQIGDRGEMARIDDRGEKEMRRNAPSQNQAIQPLLVDAVPMCSHLTTMIGAR